MAYRDEALPTCVRCHAAMQATLDEHGHRVAICAPCGCAWMDVAEFLADLRAAQPQLRVDELLEHNDGTPRRPCPRCGELMAIAWLAYLQLDQCEAHGVWFDRDELPRALAGDVIPADVKAALANAEENHRRRKSGR